MIPPRCIWNILRETFTECLVILSAKYIVKSADTIQVSLMYVDWFVFFRFVQFLETESQNWKETIDFQVMSETEVQKIF
jgi:hypothetical protein